MEIYAILSGYRWTLQQIDDHYYHIIWNLMDAIVTLSGTTWMLSWNQENGFSLFDLLVC